MTFMPRARAEGLIVSDLGDETLVYDLTSHHAHSLNESASRVWQACDGRNTIALIALNAGIPEEMVWLAVRRLATSDLLLDVESLPRETNRPVRRITAPYAPRVSRVLAPALSGRFFSGQVG